MREPSESALAAALGGAVTRERLREAIALEGRDQEPLLRALSDVPLPSIRDLSAACEAAGEPKLDAATPLTPSPRAGTILDASLLRKLCCLPLDIIDNVCILVVAKGRAAAAVSAVRDALHGLQVLPVLAPATAIVEAIECLGAPREATRHQAIIRRDSPVHARFRNLVLNRTVLDAIDVDVAQADAARIEATSP